MYIPQMIRTNAAQSSIIVSDSFDRADNASSLGNADTGQAWDVLSGTSCVIGIANNKATPESGSGTGGCTIDVPNNNVVISADVTYKSNEIAALVFRCNGTNSNRFYFALNSTKAEIVKKVSGVATNLSAYYTPLIDGTTYSLKVTINGDVITGYINETQVTTATDSSLSSLTKKGLLVYKSGMPLSTFDNFKVEAI